MKKNIFSLMLSVAFCATYPAIAMDTDEFDLTNRLMKEAIQRVDTARDKTHEKKGRAREARRTHETYAEKLEIKAIKAEQKWSRLYYSLPLLEGIIAEAQDSEEAKEILKLAVQASEARKPIENAVQYHSYANYCLTQYLETTENMLVPGDEQGMQLSQSAYEAHESLISIKKNAKDAEAAWVTAAREFFDRKREK